MAISNNSYGDYGHLPERLEVMPEFPMPTEEELAAVNDLFASYVFYKTVKGGRLLNTSCCGKKDVFFPDVRRTETPEDRELLAAKHNDEVRCPYCGRPAELRCAGIRRDSLAEWQPVLFLREMDGDILALGVWARKLYRDTARLWEGPEYHIVSAYRFSPGRAVEYENYWGNMKERVLEGSYDPGHLKIRDPFTDGGYMGGSVYIPYWVAGMDAIEKSAFRYCQYDLFWSRDGMKFHLMEYLAACCIWPRNIEMLMKCGMDKLVRDLVLGVRKNARLFRWGEQDPKKAFGLDGQEWRAFVESGYDLQALGIYKRLRSGGYRHSFPLAKSIGRLVTDKRSEDWFFGTCKETEVEPARVMRWLGWSDSLCSRGITGVFGRFAQWRDYIRFCQRLGYDLKDETVSLPRDFMRRHDAAAIEVTRLDRIEREHREAEREKELAERYRKFEEELAKRAEKYDFALGDMFIAVARTFEEIVEEGNALKHCVGGYAGRHMEGKVTILFLRRAAEPDVPFVTVEMDGNRLVQAHGFRNDAGARPPREVYAEFFNTWLDWIGRGSPRNKNGAPEERSTRGMKENIITTEAPVQEAPRTIETITAEIVMIKRTAEQVALHIAIELGRRLTEAKELLPYGEWGAWVRDKVEFSQVTASRYMKLFEEYAAPQGSLFGAETDFSTLKNLSVSKALALLAVPAEERESFAAEHRVQELSTREVQELMEKVKSSEEAKAKAESELEARTLERDDLARQVKELEARPVDVAVKEPDPEEMKRRVDTAVREAVKELKAEAKDLQVQLKEAKAKAEGAEKEAADSKKMAADAGEAAAERDRLREEIRDLEKRLSVADAAVAAVNVHFETVQVEFGKLAAGLAAIGNEDTREKVRGAVVQLLDRFRAEIAEREAAVSGTAVRSGET